MPKKKPAPNGFYYFMLEVREEMTRDLGYRPSMAQMQELANPRWTSLEPEERGFYNSMAKEKKKGLKDGEAKFNSLGVSLDVVDEQMRAEKEEIDTMKKTVERMIQIPSAEVVKNTRFYVCHVNYYYKLYRDQEDWYRPCEMAIVEFSLAEGVTDVFHVILDAGEIPLGVRADASEHAEKYHNIYIGDRPLVPKVKREKNFQKVFSDVVAFLRKGAVTKAGKEELPAVFTMPNSAHLNHNSTAVKNALELLCDAAHERRVLFRVYPLAQLFFELKLKFDPEFERADGVAILDTEIENDYFYSATNLECHYHRECDDGATWCSQSLALRWVYTVVDHVCRFAGISLVFGKHLPQGVQPPSLPQYNLHVPTQPLFADNFEDPDSELSLEQRVHALNIREQQRIREEMEFAKNLPSGAWSVASDDWAEVPGRNRRRRGGAPPGFGEHPPYEDQWETSNGFPSRGRTTGRGRGGGGPSRPESREPLSTHVTLEDFQLPVAIGRGKLFNKK